MATDRSPRFDDAGEPPSRAEIQQRVNSLYDRAESDTGNYNATRAMSGGSRRSVANSGRGAADPSIDSVARQWFDMARTSIGPTVPAVLPADRMPGRTAGASRPARATERPSDGGAVRELEAALRRELEAPQQRVPELTARAVAALPAAPERVPAAPEPKLELEPGRNELKALLPALPAPAAAPAPPSALGAALAAAPADRQSSLKNTKEQIGRKLTAARELVARAIGQSSTSLPTAASQPAEQTWGTAEQEAFRAEAAAAWAGQSLPGAGTPSALGTGAFPTTGAGLAVPSPGFPAPELGSSALTSSFPTAELGFTAPASGFPPPELGVTAPATSFPSPELGVTAPPSAFPPPELGYTAPASGAVSPAADLLTQSGQAAPAAVLQAPEPALAAPASYPAPAGVTVSGTGTAYLQKADKALAFARAQIGRPCVSGATGPESYDCSSLTQAAWKAAGVSLPRAALDQARAFTRVGLDELRPGDLVFFFDDLSHTGLCTGNGMMIHAPGPGAYIREESILAVGEGTLRGAVRPA